MAEDHSREDNQANNRAVHNPDHLRDNPDEGRPDLLDPVNNVNSYNSLP